MKNLAFSLIATSLCAVALVAQPAPEKRTVGQTLDRSFGREEKQFVSAIEAATDAQLAFAPTQGEFKGVRTLAQQAKHVAAVNYWLGSAILGEKPPVDVNKGDGPAALAAKAEVLTYLKDSYAYARKALATITEANATEPVKSPFGSNTTSRLELSTLLLTHTMDHYGQVAVYLRMNGIVPPASR